MACPELISQLRNLLSQYDNGGSSNQQVICPPTTEPCVTCCMVCPPPIMAPTVPQPVKPLQLPCPINTNNEIPTITEYMDKIIVDYYKRSKRTDFSLNPLIPQSHIHSNPLKPYRLPRDWLTPRLPKPQMSEEEAERWRYANFYNNYNKDWHSEGIRSSQPCPDPRKDKCAGVTTDGKTPCCPNNKKKIVDENKGCPTGFQPCSMKLTPPAGCHPCGVWCAEIQPCPPKPKKKVSNYEPGPCKRPCCKHWKSKDGECKYDDPCKAHCFNHPPGMKPKKRNSASAC